MAVVSVYDENKIREKYKVSSIAELDTGIIHSGFILSNGDLIVGEFGCHSSIIYDVYGSYNHIKVLEKLPVLDFTEYSKAFNLSGFFDATPAQRKTLKDLFLHLNITDPDYIDAAVLNLDYVDICRMLG